MRRIKYKDLKIGNLYYWRYPPNGRYLVMYLGYTGQYDIDVKILYWYRDKLVLKKYIDNLTMQDCVFEEIECKKLKLKTTYSR